MYCKILANSFFNCVDRKETKYKYYKCSESDDSEEHYNEELNIEDNIEDYNEENQDNKKDLNIEEYDIIEDNIKEYDIIENKEEREIDDYVFT
tara:strand:+ start:3970 stop:4248 length:279 start_codon:yes stop_codon:yes gene_type:complete